MKCCSCNERLGAISYLSIKDNEVLCCSLCAHTHIKLKYGVWAITPELWPEYIEEILTKEIQ